MNLKSFNLLFALLIISNQSSNMDHTPLSYQQKQAIKDELISVTITSNHKQFIFRTKSNSMPINSRSLDNCIANCCFFAQNCIGETINLTNLEEIKKLPRSIRKEIANTIIDQKLKATRSEKIHRD